VTGMVRAVSAAIPHAGQNELSVQVKRIVPQRMGEAPRGATKADERPAGSDPTNCGNWFWIFKDNERSG
jgi:hypothetical protein